MAKYATARKSPGRTAVAGNRLPPVDLLFEHPPDVQNGEIRHRKSTPLNLLDPTQERPSRYAEAGVHFVQIQILLVHGSSFVIDVDLCCVM